MCGDDKISGNSTSVVQEPNGSSAGTVEPRATATQSLNLSTDTPPEEEPHHPNQKSHQSQS